jgi:hypothetical protein
LKSSRNEAIKAIKERMRKSVWLMEKGKMWNKEKIRREAGG